MAKQYSVTYDGYDQWLIPLNLAVGFHLLIAFSIIFLPGMFKSKPKFEDIYTVNLINLADQLPEQSAPAPAPPPSPPPAETVVEQPPETAAVNIDPQPAPPPQPVANPVSLKPLKQKVKKVVQPEPDRTLARQREAERLRRQQLAEALQAEQRAAEQARLAAEEAARQQRLLEQQLAQIQRQAQTTPSPSAARSGSSSSASALSVLERQYYTAIVNRISQFWSLPEFRQFDPSTQAVVVITISQNGTITRQLFERQSNDPTFDQFVRKALQDANPLPPIPPALRKSSFEIGLRFSPSSIN